MFEELTPPYSTLVIDPPWQYDDAPMARFASSERSKRPFLPYSSMHVDEIAAMPVGALAGPGAHLYLWTTQRYLWDAKRIAEGWGWTVLQILTWCKAPMGMRLFFSVMAGKSSKR